MLTQRVTGTVLGSAIEVTDFDRACEFVLALARLGRPAYVCFATAHMLVEASRDLAVGNAYKNATFIAPDGTPVAWCLRLKGHRGAMCISGPRTMPLLLEAAHAHHLRVGFYGGRPETLDLLEQRLAQRIPGLKIVYRCSPPFRELTRQEQEEHLRQVSATGVQLLFVGLGSPKQERWMQEFSPSLNCVCLGVGAAFEFLSGEKVLPPLWIQKMGMTWFVRLCQEPRRLARRNLYSFVFVGKVLQELVADRLSSRSSPAQATQPARRSYREPDAAFDGIGPPEFPDPAPAWAPLVADSDSLVLQGKSQTLSSR